MSDEHTVTTTKLAALGFRSAADFYYASRLMAEVAERDFEACVAAARAKVPRLSEEQAAYVFAHLGPAQEANGG